MGGSPEVKERAVRMVFEPSAIHEAGWPARPRNPARCRRLGRGASALLGFCIATGAGTESARAQWLRDDAVAGITVLSIAHVTVFVGGGVTVGGTIYSLAIDEPSTGWAVGAFVAAPVNIAGGVAAFLYPVDPNEKAPLYGIGAAHLTVGAANIALGVANIVLQPEPEPDPDGPGPYLSIDSVVDVAGSPVPMLGVGLRL
ncbi:MAG: hypothetical protein RIF41_37610 [Polyangiaceae bacterium]